MPSSVKLEKEASVFGQTGTTLLENALLIACLPLLLSISSANSFIEDFFSIVLPLLISHTIAADELPFGAFLTPLICLFWLYYDPPLKNSPNVKSKKKENYSITVLRGTTVLSTVISILAVDFPSVYPRRFVKTEWYGTGLMDIGVGAYIFTGAIVRGNKPVLSLGKLLISTLPVMMLGVLRVIVNKSVDYQEHESEYGGHWNFFLTLASVRMISELFSLISGSSKEIKIYLGIILLILHQTLLSSTILGVWVLEDDLNRKSRNNLLWENKEGLISLMGYISLDVLVRGCSEIILKLNSFGLFVLDVLLWGMLNLSISFVENVSRRSANLSYVLWILAIGVMIVFLAEFLLKDAQPSPIIKILSAHQLSVFLLANILTGIVNLSFDTLHATKLSSLIILSFYLLLNCSLAYLMEKMNLSF